MVDFSMIRTDIKKIGGGGRTDQRDVIFYGWVEPSVTKRNEGEVINPQILRDVIIGQP